MTSARRKGWIGSAMYIPTVLVLLTPALAQTTPVPNPPVQKPALQKPTAQEPAQKAQPASGSAPERPKVGPSPIQLKAEPSQPEWTKVCDQDPAAKAEICYTTRDFVSDDGRRVLSVAIYDVKASKSQKTVRFLMPLGLLLPPGIRFAVDQGESTSGRYGICFPNGCFAEAQVKNEFVASLKKGAALNVSAQNQAGQMITLAIPTAGFSKAYDGAPIDPQVLAQQQKSMQEALQKRSDELRQRLQQQGEASALVAPAVTADAVAN